MWKFPWRFKESFTITFGFIILGLSLEIVTPGSIIKPLQYPVNVYTGIVFIFLLVAFWLFFRHTNVFCWITSVPAAISAISGLALLTLLMGFIPQDDAFHTFFSKLGLTHLTHSWPFLFIVIYFESILGFTLLKRLNKFTFKDSSFVLNHLGLWMIVFAVAFGRGDLKRWNMYIQEKDTVWYAYDEEKEERALDFALKLKDFHIDQYNPKVTLIDAEDYIIPEPYQNQMFEADDKVNGRIGEWSVKIDTFYRYAVNKGNRYLKMKMEGASFAAHVTAVHQETGKTERGWVSPGSYRMQPAAIRLNNDLLLSITQPEPKKYYSEMDLYIKGEDTKQEVKLEVNKPLKVQGWKVYQQGYNEKRGRWSRMSILEIVKDPWLPVVYAGIFLLMAGALMLFWSGRRKQTNQS